MLIQVSVVAHGPSCPMPCGIWPHAVWDLSSPTRDRTSIPCIGRRTLYHWTTWEVPVILVDRGEADRVCSYSGKWQTRAHECWCCWVWPRDPFPLWFCSCKSNEAVQSNLECPSGWYGIQAGVLCFFRWNKQADTYLPTLNPTFPLWIPHLASSFCLEPSTSVVWSSEVMMIRIWTNGEGDFYQAKAVCVNLDFSCLFSFLFWQQTLMLEDTLPLISGKHQIFGFYLHSDWVSFKLFL